MSRRHPVTIVLRLSGDRGASRRLLTELAAQGAHGDNAVFIRPDGHLDHSTWRTLDSRSHWQRVEDAAHHLARPHEAIVYVDDRVEGRGPWVDRLVELALQDGVGAVAPRTNWATGDELLVGVPYRPPDSAARGAHLRSHDGSSPEAPTEVGCLRGPCIATTLRTLTNGDDGLRDMAFGEFGGQWGTPFDPINISLTAKAEGRRLLVAEDVYLHHPGGAVHPGEPSGGSRPLVSACLIVKNEETDLERCLFSAAAVADEIVVYDTGSTDRTVEIARRFTPHVIEGYWDDDFSRARNAALAHCNGEWILWLDADEALECPDPAAFRQVMSGLSTDIEGLIVLIDNLRGSEAATPLTHPACRLFRRSVGHWTGTIHEQITALAGFPAMAIAAAGAIDQYVRIRHWGYLQTALVGKSKGERNRRVAFSDLAGVSDLDVADRIVSLGRSQQLVAGSQESGIELCQIGAALANNPATKRLALRGVAEGLTETGRFDEAIVAIEELRALGADQLANYLAATAHLAAERWTEALWSYDAVRPGLDPDGFEYTSLLLAGGRAKALHELGRSDEAAALLLEMIGAEGSIDAHLGLLIEALEASDRDLGSIYDAIGADRVLAFVPQLRQIAPAAADRCLDAFYGRDPSARAVLAVAATTAIQLELDRQVVWSRRLRDAGLPGACPLVAAAASDDITMKRRLACARAAMTEFMDPRGAMLLSALERPAAIVAPGTGFKAAPNQRQRVLIVANEVASLEAISAAAVLHHIGHEVRILQPAPAEPTLGVLDGLGIDVFGWADNPDGEWSAAALSAASIVYGGHPVDTVLLGRGTAVLAEDLRRLMPLANVVEHIERWLPLTVVDALSVGTPAPLSERCGIVIAANTRCLDAAVATAYVSHFSPIVGRDGFTIPIVTMGDDPGGLSKRTLPLAVDAGTVADPSRLVGAARVLVVVGDQSAPHWLRLGALCGTPTFVMPPEPEMAKALAEVARGLATNEKLWLTNAPDPSQLPERVAIDTDPLPHPRRLPAPPEGRSVILVGAVRSHASLSKVNRELAVRLAGDARFDFAVNERGAAANGSGASEQLRAAGVRFVDDVEGAALEIRHGWPPDFTAPAGKLAVILPWEYGPYPAEWVGAVRDVVDEVWVPSEYVRQCAIDGGVDPAKVVVVPNGVDTERYRPDGPKRKLQTTKGTRFLFVGGLVDRKGADALLEAYLSSFTAEDDVCLVVKPFGSSTTYDTSAIEPTLRRAAESPIGPAVEIIDGDLSEDEMAALYRSCTALVHPYRGEGFALPVAEAMACGLPVIVTKGGATDSYCDEETGWVIASSRQGAATRLLPRSGFGWWLEPSRLSLIAAMREVAANPDGAAARGRAARRRIEETLTWDSAAAIAAERICALLDSTTPRTDLPPEAPMSTPEQPTAESVPATPKPLNLPMPSLSIVVPVGPGAESAKALGWAVEAAKRDDGVELIVIDDSEVLGGGPAGRVHGDRVRVFREMRWMGYSGAIATGVEFSRGDVVLIADADVSLTAGNVAAIRSQFALDPGIGVCTPAMDGAKRSPIPPVIAIRRNAIEGIGGPARLRGQADVIDDGRAMVVSRQIVAALLKGGWRWASAGFSVKTTDGLVRWWPENGARSTYLPFWLPCEIPEHPEPGVNVIGLLDAVCGIGDAGRRYTEAVEAVTPVATFAWHGHASPEVYERRHADSLRYDTNLVVLNQDLLAPLLGYAGVDLRRDRYQIGLWFWELEELPEKALASYSMVDEVWASTNFLRDAFARYTDKPVRRVPMPVRRRDGQPIIPRSQLGLPSEFCFLASFDFKSVADRKNPMAAVHAFCEAFTPGEGPVLVLKTMGASNDAPGWHALQRAIGGRRDVVLIDTELSDDEMTALIGSADCYVSLHRSEGFGLSLAEAMAWGRPVIATAWSGNTDFMTEENSFLVPFSWGAVPPELGDVYPVGARWADADVAAAARAMRTVWEDRAETQQRALRGQADVRRDLSTEAVAAVIRERLAEIRIARSRKPAGKGAR